MTRIRVMVQADYHYPNAPVEAALVEIEAHLKAYGFKDVCFGEVVRDEFGEEKKRGKQES